MAVETACVIPSGGFNFDNCLRNAFFDAKGYPMPKTKKTGTTIAGIVFKDGVILGADTRATSDTIVADKNCTKIHYLAPNMYCCGAGTAADTFKVCDMVSSQLELHRLATDRVVPVATAMRMLKQHLFRYQGHIGAALIIGGVDTTGPTICSVAPHGSSDNSPYTTMGSGCLAAMSVFEQGWKPDLTLEEGQKLVRDAIAGGIFNDLGSGSSIDLCVITKDGTKYMRPYEIANVKGLRQNKYSYKRGATAVLTTQIIPLDVETVTVKPVEEKMDTSS